MKKLLALAAIVTLTFIGCKKDSEEPAPSGGGGTSLTVEKKNRTLLVDFSEDWCPPCGSSGGPAFDSLLSYEKTLLTAIKVYGGSNNSDLDCAIGNSFFSIYNNTTYGGNGIPKFIIANVHQPVYTTWASTVNQSLTKANTFAADSVIAGVALNKAIVGDSIKINTKVQFFKEQLAGSDYRLALYVVESNVISSQSTNTGSVANYQHKNLVRICNSSSYGGVVINNSTAVSMDQVFENSFTLGLKPGWDKSKLKVVAAIWKFNSNPAKVINSNVSQ
ncbi:MAG: Omp28-related outer membrane protein [Bacteroidetes bacterium]|nr:Omp28-related outer membrane protein [Bacteroidota bacterium]MBK9400841.1 Omp28-related outer membrane protein [Bacteroidota bacterium]